MDLGRAAGLGGKDPSWHFPEGTSIGFVNETEGRDVSDFRVSCLEAWVSLAGSGYVRERGEKRGAAFKGLMQCAGSYDSSHLGRYTSPRPEGAQG